MKATICLIPYKNDKRFFKILDRILLTEGEYKIMVMDNNLDRHLEHRLKDYNVKYYHHGNLRKLAGATNRAIEFCDTEYFVYLCSNHVHVYSNDWLTCMVKEMDKLPKAAMAGDLIRFSRDVHVQGGIFIARTEMMRKVPYRTKYPFSYMDVYIKKDIVKAGYEVGKIMCMKSVMLGFPNRKHVENKKTKKFKIVHAHDIHKTR